MRKRVIAVVVGGLLAAAGALAGCPAAHSGYPGTSCKTNSDCYVGEICSSALICVPNLDMAITGDFAHPPFDIGATDMSPGDDAGMTSGDDL